MIALGIDPGFSALGWALVDLRVKLIVNMGVICTEKANKKRGILSVDDNVQRTREIHRELKLVMDGHKHMDLLPSVVCAEAMSFPRNASVAAKVSLTWGVLITMLEARQVPLLQVSPQDAKKRVCGTKTASKEDVKAAVLLALRVDGEPLAGVRAGLHEHAYDAAAMVLACAESDVMRAYRRVA